jgi:4-diphosphocytidyl-2-C-methyl-D-erythritol kinase
MLTLFSPAKINLFLRILGKRPDGFHELASLFQTIGVGDTLRFKFAIEDRLTCTDPSLLCDGSNLIMRAVQLFRRKTGLKDAVDIHLVKKIPVQAGLGGGSSNAATTLWALNALHEFPYSEQELQLWAAEIGSDISFFFSQGTAYCTGRGEIVRNLPPVPGLPPLTLEKPDEGLSTLAIFKALQLDECSKKDPEDLLASFYAGHHNYINDLEAPALRLCPALAALKGVLVKKYDGVFMTGSGSALICLGKESIPLAYRKRNAWY